MHLLTTFQKVFRRAPEVTASAPGALAVIGDEAGHDAGLVLGVAAGRRTWVTVARRPDRRAYVRCLSVGGETALSLDRLDRSWGWADTVAGVLAVLKQAGHRLDGFELLAAEEALGSGGMTATTALSVAVVTALDGLFGLGLGPMDRARVCWQAGLLTSTEDSLSGPALSAGGEAGRAIVVDGSDMTRRVIPLALRDYRLAAVESGLRLPVAATERQRLRDECAQALAAAVQRHPGLERLRDSSEADLDGAGEPLVLRARYVRDEADRVRRAAEALEDEDISGLGRLLTESQESSRSAFGVQPPELEGLVKLVQSSPGVAGARLTRDGELPQVVCLIHENAIEQLQGRVQNFYYKRHGRSGEIRIVETPAAGASVVPPESPAG